jgi:hypothetical protein
MAPPRKPYATEAAILQRFQAYPKSGVLGAADLEADRPPPELVELERDRNKARSRRKPQALRFKRVTVGDLI